ncbi:PhoH family protein, partial [Escherichia coli]|uniref:PhoH family protein n=1 Tax=Escherichia coli TaxID=562 RepID=UPI0034DB7C02
AQNCSAQQLELFISRLGYNGRMIITGDPTQSDLHGVPLNKNPFGLLVSGMRNVQEVSEDVRVWDFDPAEHNQRHLALPGLLSV